MILYPAIDLKAGTVVRLYQGDMDQATLYNADPVDQARRFAVQGCEWLHIVDLDGAFAGVPCNRTVVREILQAVDIPVQLGGGIRDLSLIEDWFSEGVARVILGTAAVRDPDLVRVACRLAPGQVAVGIDAREGKVAVAGWTQESEMQDVDLARRFEDIGVAAIIYTDITRDGTLTGVNIMATQDLAAQLCVPVIASGGVQSLHDVKRVRRAGNIEGLVVGRALYDGGLDLTAALAECA